MPTDLEKLKERQAAGETLTAEELALLAAETDDGDEFDKERAMATIKKLRAQEKEAKAKLARLAELEAESEKRKTAEMTDAEKAKAELAKIAPELEKLRKERQELLLQKKLDSTARDLKIEFASVKAQETAYRLLDTELVGEDGEGMKEALTALQKEHGYLFSGETNKKLPPSDIDAQKKGKGSTSLENADIVAKKRQEYGSL